MKRNLVRLQDAKRASLILNGLDQAQGAVLELTIPWIKLRNLEAVSQVCKGWRTLVQEKLDLVQVIVQRNSQGSKPGLRLDLLIQSYRFYQIGLISEDDYRFLLGSLTNRNEIRECYLDYFELILPKAPKQLRGSVRRHPRFLPYALLIQPLPKLLLPKAQMPKEIDSILEQMQHYKVPLSDRLRVIDIVLDKCVFVPGHERRILIESALQRQPIGYLKQIGRLLEKPRPPIQDRPWVNCTIKASSKLCQDVEYLKAASAVVPELASTLCTRESFASQLFCAPFNIPLMTWVVRQGSPLLIAENYRGGLSLEELDQVFDLADFRFRLGTGIHQVFLTTCLHKMHEPLWEWLLTRIPKPSTDELTYWFIHASRIGYASLVKHGLLTPLLSAYLQNHGRVDLTENRHIVKLLLVAKQQYPLEFQRFVDEDWLEVFAHRDFRRLIGALWNVELERVPHSILQQPPLVGMRGDALALQYWIAKLQSQLD